MQTFKKRDRVVTPDGLGHIVHIFDAAGRDINVKIGNYIRRYSIASKIFNIDQYLRPATSKDFKKGKAEIYKREDKKWDYRIIQKNGNLLASSKQGYQNRVDMIKVLNNNFIDFEIVQL